MATLIHKNEVIKVTEIRKTCQACPAQWEGKAVTGYIYARFRWGHFEVRLGGTTDDAIDGDLIFEWDDVSRLNGFMEYEQFKVITAGVLDLPDNENDRN